MSLFKSFLILYFGPGAPRIVVQMLVYSRLPFVINMFGVRLFDTVFWSNFGVSCPFWKSKEVLYKHEPRFSVCPQVVLTRHYWSPWQQNYMFPILQTLKLTETVTIVSAQDLILTGPLWTIKICWRLLVLIADGQVSLQIWKMTIFLEGFC